MKKRNIHFNKVKYSQSASTCTQKTEVLFLTTSFLAHTHTQTEEEREKKQHSSLRPAVRSGQYAEDIELCLLLGRE